MPRDPIVAEVRHAREEFSARFNHDIHAIGAHIREREMKLRQEIGRASCRERV